MLAHRYHDVIALWILATIATYLEVLFPHVRAYGVRYSGLQQVMVRLSFFFIIGFTFVLNSR